MNPIIQSIINEKIIVIFRQIYDNDLLKAVKSLNQGGICCVEITFDQSDHDCIKKTSDAIKLISQNFPDMFVGAGTVVSIEQLLAAKEAGAKYIISPNTDGEIIQTTKQLNLISIPGATTPSEILSAHKYGADFVKIFPSNSLGLPYIKDLTGPINHVKFIVAAGISEENINDYLEIGCVGFGISGRLTDKKLIQNNHFEELQSRAEKFVRIIKNHQNSHSPDKKHD